MKRILFLIILGMVVTSFGLLVNCSSPLDTTTGPDVNPGGDTTIVDTLYLIDTVILIDSSGQTDTLFIIDTVIQYDTLIVFDSTGQVDTIFIVDTTFLNDTIIIIDTTIIFDTLTVYDTMIVYDTTTIVDTVIIVESDTLNSGFICGQLGAHRKDLVWMFQNEAGLITLEFAANSEYDHPTQVLTVEIDGQEIIWQLEETMELVLDQELSENALISIVPDKPSAFGHEVDICLTISPTE